MKNNTYIYTITKTIIFGFTLLLLNACHKELDVENFNNPDSENVFSDPADVYNIASDGFFNWFMTQTSSLSPRMAMWVAADQGTCSWANSGMYHFSDEPRRSYNNDVSYTYANIFATYYADLYGTIGIMNKVLTKADEGMQFGDNGRDTKMIKAYSAFIQGITLGYLGLVYDQAYIVTEKNDPTKVELSPYAEVLDSAIARLEKTIAICDKANFKLPEEWINGSKYDEDELAELAHSFIARFMVYGSRNKDQNNQIDWNSVLDHANNGIKRSLDPYMDNTKWYCWYRHYTTSRAGWARIDSRIINLMDNAYPSRFPEDGVNPQSASSSDSRLNTDFNFAASNNMKPERGYVHYSNYEYSRHEYTTDGDGQDNVEVFPLAENELFKAEAYAMTGDLSSAISIINAGSRTTRGNLVALSSSSDKKAVLDAIFYERDIELIQTGFGTAFFDMRRRDYLQKGTPLHFPIPAVELEVLELSTYSFGGVGNADGTNTSNGGWVQ